MNKEFDLFLNSIYTLRQDIKEGKISYCYMVDRFKCPFNIKCDNYSICNCVLRGRLERIVK